MKRRFQAISFILTIAISALAVSAQTTFTGSGLGAVPDGAGTSTCGAPGTPLDVTFNVSGISGAVTNVSVSLTMTHTWMNDVRATLIAPNGATHVLFGHTGATTANGCGFGSDLAGPYVFEDAASSPPSGGWWQAAAAGGSTSAIVPSGTYRTTNSGGLGATNPMPPTAMNASFAGVTNANGTWTLRITDGGVGDFGNVTAASLTLTGQSAPPVVADDSNVDFNGDGKTDFGVIRRDDPPTLTNPSLALRNAKSKKNGKSILSNLKSLGDGSDQLYWYVEFNGGTGSRQAPWGLETTDTPVPADFDGDGKDDFGIWRQGALGDAAFIWLNSENYVFGASTFGQEGDDVTVTADYDGDGKDDMASFRCPLVGEGQCGFYYRGTFENPDGVITYVPWGWGSYEDFYAYPGDFDGDGKNDFCVQTTYAEHPQQGLFYLLRSSDLQMEAIFWGLANDFLIPGDYDGDGKSDFLVHRQEPNGQMWNHILFRNGNEKSVQWGNTGANDVPAPGDYDGDGKQDIAIYRWYDTYAVFFVIRSSDNAVEASQYGLPGDWPLALWYVH